MGRRPQNDRSEVKDTVIKIRVTKEMHDKIVQESALQGKSASEFLRESALENIELLEEIRRAKRH